MNLQGKCEQMTEYIKKLRLCIKWFQELEESYVLEQGKLRDLLESSDRKCSELGNLWCAVVLNFERKHIVVSNLLFSACLDVQMKNKIEELETKIAEFREKCASLEEKIAKVESEKMVSQ